MPRGMGQKVRVGVIGIGFGQQVHVPAFRSDPRCEVRALCASTEARAWDVATRQGIPKAYGDWRGMIKDPEIDAVTIATPPTVQAVIAAAVLAQKKHVFCEKPLAASLDSAFTLQAAAERAGTANMVNFEFPEIEEWRRAKEILDAGHLGRLLHIHVSWHVESYAHRLGLRSWKTRAAEGGGVLNGLVSHCLYYLEWLFGPIQKLAARLYNSAGGEDDGNTLAVLCLEIGAATPVSVSVSNDAFLGVGHRVEIYGEEGALVLENRTSDYVNGFELLVGTRKTKCLTAAASGEPREPVGRDGRVAVMGRLVERFVDWILTGRASIPNFKDGYRVQLLLDAARRSHTDGTWRVVPPRDQEQALPEEPGTI